MIYSANLVHHYDLEDAEQRQRSGLAADVYKEAKVAERDSMTAKYLMGRGIDYESWGDLDLPLKEAEYKGEVMVAMYPFVNKTREIVGINRTYVDAVSLEKKQKRHLGRKSMGIGLLKDAERVVVAEGLENALSARQHLGNHYGVVVCGDANGMKSLAGKHAWCMVGRSGILIAADNDLEDVGGEAARLVYCRFPRVTLIYMPSQPGRDWNDILRQGRLREEWK